MKHTAEVQRKYDFMSKELRDMQQRHEKLSLAHDALKKKEMEFNEVIANKLAQQNEVDTLMAQRDRLAKKNETLNGANQV